jgi:hypothetical protein
VEGYNYEEMYNVMVNNLINNFIPSHNFIYTYAQVEELYNLLDELLNPIQTDIESNNVEVIETNETNHEDDWSDEDTEIDPNQIDNTNIINIINPNQNMQYYYNIQINDQTHAEQQLIHYLNNMNNINNLNMNNNNLN